MLRYHKEYGIYKELYGRWLKDDRGGSYIKVVAKSDNIWQKDWYLHRHPELFHQPLGRLVPVSRDEDYDLGDDTEALPPNNSTRYVLFTVDDLAHDGILKTTSRLTKAIWDDGEIITHQGFIEELEAKYLRTKAYMRLSLFDLLRSLVPFDEPLFDAISSDPRIYYSLMDDAYASHSFIQSQHLPLGILTDYFQSPHNRQGCNRDGCGGMFFLVQVRRGMSLGYANGFCSICGKVLRDVSGDAYFPIHDMIRKMEKPTERPYRFDTAIERLREAVGGHGHSNRGE